MLPPSGHAVRPGPDHSRSRTVSSSATPGSATSSESLPGGVGLPPRSASSHLDYLSEPRGPPNSAGDSAGWGLGGSAGGGGRSDRDLQDRHEQVLVDRDARAALNGVAAGPSQSRVPMTIRGDIGEGGYGHVVSIERGTLAGTMMRFRLTMEQQPVHARQKANKDRRPIVHCPILRLRMKEVRSTGSGAGLSALDEDDVDVNLVEPGQFLCCAELFQVDASSATVMRDETQGPPKAGRMPHRNSLPNVNEDTNMDLDQKSREKSHTPPGGRDVVMASPSPLPSGEGSAPGDHTPIPSTRYADAPRRPNAAGRSATWVGDHVASLPGVTEANRYPDLYGKNVENSPPIRLPTPATPSFSSSGISTGNTTTPTSFDQAPPTPRPGIDIRPVFPRPADLSVQHQNGESSGKVNSDELPARLAGNARTAADRSSESGGSGDSATAKPAPKRPKQLAQRFLFGNLHVPAVRIQAEEGDMGLWFLFTDLAVKEPGFFALRFRVYDIASSAKSEGTSSPVLAEAESQTFQVLVPREYPGIPKPTKLADHFARQGFKLNTRKNEKQIKTPPPEDAPAPTTKVKPPRPQRPPSPPPLETKVSAVTAHSSQHSLGYQPASTGRISTLQHTSSDERSTLLRDSSDDGSIGSIRGVSISAGHSRAQPPLVLSRSLESTDEEDMD